MEPELVGVISYLQTEYIEMENAHVWKSAYIEDPDVMAVFITDANRGDMLKVSVNLPGIKPAKGSFFLKDYSENKGILQELLADGIVTSITRVVSAGYEVVAECQLAVDVAELTNS